MAENPHYSQTDLHWGIDFKNKIKQRKRTTLSSRCPFILYADMFQLLRLCKINTIIFLNFQIFQK